jgi:predicted transcriptional regulator/transcriptional regulator with XRE-family HTH domain
MESGLGLKIRDARKRLGLTQAKVAEAVGISTSYFNLIERNKRPIGGALVLRIARELEMDPALLDDDAERRLITQLTEMAADPLLSGLDLDPVAVPSLVGRHPSWSRALALLHRECRDRGEVVDALSDRLRQDPELADVVHRMLTNISGIRSTAEILDSVEDLAPDQSARFRATLAAESARLSDAAQALADFFDRTEAPKQALTASEEVDDFFIANNTWFPTLEDEAARLRERIGADGAGGERALTARLEAMAEADWQRPKVGLADEVDDDPLADLETAMMARGLEEGAAPPSRRMALAGRLVWQVMAEPIRALVDAAPELGSPAARRRAAGALVSYGAGALLFPYQPFLEDAERLRYDIGMMRRRYRASFEQVCQRFVSLRRPGAEGLPFAMLRADPAGTLSKRFPLPRLALPRHGAACPLWAIYRAFQTPGPVVRQVAELPTGDRFLFIARVVRKGVDSFTMPARQVSVALACSVQFADRLVYGDGLDLSSHARADPVGVSCRVCPRTDCRHRTEAPIMPA